MRLQSLAVEAQLAPFGAAQYYRQGLVTKILIDGPDSESILLKLGVPKSAIEAFGHALRNTHVLRQGC
jgi:hypothetical protein